MGKGWSLQAQHLHLHQLIKQDCMTDILYSLTRWQNLSFILWNYSGHVIVEIMSLCDYDLLLL